MDLSLRTGTDESIRNSNFNNGRLAVAHDTGIVYYDLTIGSNQKRIKTGRTAVITSSTTPIGGSYKENDIWFETIE